MDEYIAKQKSPQKEICRKLREILLKTLPGLKEENKWGALVYDGGKFYIGAVRYGVNLGFAINGLNGKEVKEFQGPGKTMRHIKIVAVEDINEKKLGSLIKLVHVKAIVAS